MLQTTSNDFDAYFGRGSVLTNMGRLNEALTDFNTAIRLNPYNRQAYRFRAVVYQRLARVETNLQRYFEYLRMAENDLRTASTLE